MDNIIQSAGSTNMYPYVTPKFNPGRDDFGSQNTDNVSYDGHLDTFNKIVRDTRRTANPTPLSLRSEEAADYNGMSLEKRLSLLKTIKKDRLCAIDFGRGTFKLQGPGKYNFEKADVMLSLDGKMYYYHYDQDNCPCAMNVVMGYTESDIPYALIKTGEKCDYMGEDTRDVRRPEFFAARLVVRRLDDSESVANYFYHAATNQLSCNITGEMPDAGASDLVFKLLANFIYISSMNMLK